MPHKSHCKTALVLSILIVMILISACGQAAPAVPPATAQLATTAPQATSTPPAPPTMTATAAPTNTEAPTLTSTPAPTLTPQPSQTSDPAKAKKELSGWCLPAEVLVSAASDPLKPPERAQVGAMENGALEIKNMPFSVCVFLYTFEQAAPTGLKLEVYDLKQQTPWLKAALQPVEGKSNMVFTRLRHSYIIDPPLWNIGYEFVLRDSSGAELQRTVVNLHRWTTGLCWQGTLPDPVTLYCPLQQDLHPWDPGYGKKLPTVTPRP